eukprot:gene10391-12762_t
MYIKIQNLILFIFILINVIKSEPIPLSVCGSARAVGSDISENGACRLPKPGVGLASISVGAFSGGIRCGECFRLTGPLGSTVVMVNDVCDAGEPCQQTDLFHFIIDTDDYNKISNSSKYGNVYSLGYQEVSCEHDSNILVTFNRDAATANVDYSYYLTVSFTYYSVGIERVQIMGTGMSGYQDMKLSNGGIYTWNKKDGSGPAASKFSFPGKLLITGVDGETIVYQFSKPIAGKAYDTMKQFTPKQHPKAAEGICSMAMVPTDVYKDHVSYGWDTSFSFSYAAVNFAEDPGDNPNLNEHSIKISFNTIGGLQFSREGGFTTKFFKYLSFDAKADPPTNKLKIHFGKDGNYMMQTNITNEWKSYNVSIADLAPKEIEDALVFLNLVESSNAQTYWFDNIKWVFTDDAPETPAVVVDTTTGFPTPRPSSTSTSTTGGSVTSGATSGGSIPTGSATGEGGDGDGGDGGQISTTDKDQNNNNSNNSNIIYPSLLLILINMNSLTTFWKQKIIEDFGNSKLDELTKASTETTDVEYYKIYVDLLNINNEESQYFSELYIATTRAVFDDQTTTLVDMILEKDLGAVQYQFEVEKRRNEHYIRDLVKPEIKPTKKGQQPIPPSLDRMMLIFSVAVGSFEIVKFILENGGMDLINFVDPVTSVSPFHVAILSGNRDIIRLLIEKNAKVDMVDSFRATAFDYARMKGMIPFNTPPNPKTIQIYNHNNSGKFEEWTLDRIESELNISYCPRVLGSIDYFVDLLFSSFDINPDVKFRNKYLKRIMKSGGEENVILGWISDKIGWGIYANKDFQRGDYILRYGGMITLDEKMTTTNYNMMISAEGFGLDASKYRCLGGMVNHSNKFSNAESECIFEYGCEQAIITATRFIPKGAQIFIDYSHSYWQEDEISTNKTLMIEMGGTKDFPSLIPSIFTKKD